MSAPDFDRTVHVDPGDPGQFPPVPADKGSDPITVRMAAHQHERYLDRLADIAADLRSLADRVEREGEARPRFGAPENFDHVTGAAGVVHAVTWGVANLNLDILLADAADADSLDGQL